jgi:amino acid transporter
MMIGAGVFVTTGIGIGVAGPGGILLAFALNGLLAFLSVMTYAELSSAIPRAGAGYSYIQESIGGFTGFLSGWISWFAHAVAGSLYAITLSQYTLHFLAQFEMFHWLHANLPLFEKGFAVLMALIFIYINYRGASETGTAGAVMAIGQTIVLALDCRGGDGHRTDGCAGPYRADWRYCRHNESWETGKLRPLFAARLGQNTGGDGIQFSRLRGL